MSTKYHNWNPWHGCTKISPGCTHCYVYRQDAMYGSERDSREVSLNRDFDLPLRHKRDGSFKIESGATVITCLTSDFLLPEADMWREEAWRMMRQRSDLTFLFFTKRIDRFCLTLPPDWDSGYDNVVVACSVENQEMADLRLPIFLEAPIKHRMIAAAPLLERLDLRRYLSPSIDEVSVGGESGDEARICDWKWILDLRQQCVEHQVPFCFHQTGARLRKDNKIYRIKRAFQISQAQRANINYRIDSEGKPTDR